MGCRYRVKLPFGVASVRPSGIMHSLPQPDGSMMVRRNGVMGKDENPAGTGEGLFAEKLNKKFELMFATESVYVFMRLYCLLVSLLTDIREHVKTLGPGTDPADSYFIPKPIQDEKDERRKAPPPKADFSGVVSMLGRVLARKVDAKEYETYCRKVCRSKVHQMVALPKLVDKCTDALLNVVKEGALLPLFDYCLHREMVRQHTIFLVQGVGLMHFLCLASYTFTFFFRFLQDPVQLRSLCLSITPEASYRIQYDTSKAHIFFSYLPEGEELLTVPQEDDDMQEDDDAADDEDAAMKDADDAPDDGDDGDADAAETKEGDDAEGKDGTGPPSKRSKLK